MAFAVAWRRSRFAVKGSAGETILSDLGGAKDVNIMTLPAKYRVRSQAGARTKFFGLASFILGMSFLGGAALSAGQIAPQESPTAVELSQAIALPRDYQFDKTMPREVLDSYLSRAISMEGLLNGRGDLDDNIRMLKHIGAKFIGRSLCLWAGEANLLRGSRTGQAAAPQGPRGRSGNDPASLYL